MSAIKDKEQRHSRLVLGALLVYLGISVAAIWTHRYHINPDGTAYLDIARSYLAGHWECAINAYWSPLFSWLIVPWLAVGVNALLAAKIVTWLCGLAVVVAMRRVARTLGVTPHVLNVLSVGLLGFVLAREVTVVCPDLLTAAVLLFGLAVVVSPAYDRDVWRGPVAGALGALGYLAKAYALPFFLLHFVLVNAIQWRWAGPGAPRRRVVRNLVTGLFVFAGLCAPWVGVLRAKYGQTMLGSAGQINLRLYAFGSRGHVHGWAGLLALPHADATSSWDDPTPLADQMVRWAPWASAAALKHQFLVVVRTTYMAFRHTVLAMPFLVVVLVVGLQHLRGGHWDHDERRGLWLLLLSAGLYTAGLLPMYVEERYLFYALVVGVVLTAVVVERLLRAGALHGPGATLVLWSLAAALALPALLELRDTHSLGRDDYTTAVALRDAHGVRGNLASNGRWQESLQLAFCLNGKYLGKSRAGLSAPEFIHELREHGVDYYLVWNDGAAYTDALSGCRELDCGTLKSLRVYDVRSLRAGAEGGRPPLCFSADSVVLP